MALDAKKALEVGDLPQFGKLLDKSWRLKKKLATNISNPTIDALYDKAIRAGAIGGKITGAGGGGFLMLMCPPENQQRVRQSLGELRELRCRFESYGSRVLLNTGR
jgi:D-glycero-alpha-D-manno-heptose-7-phosphate kinase